MHFSLESRSFYGEPRTTPRAAPPQQRGDRCHAAGPRQGTPARVSHRFGGLVLKFVLWWWVIICRSCWYSPTALFSIPISEDVFIHEISNGVLLGKLAQMVCTTFIHYYCSPYQVFRHNHHHRLTRLGSHGRKKPKDLHRIMILRPKVGFEYLMIKRLFHDQQQIISVSFIITEVAVKVSVNSNAKPGIHDSHVMSR